jgi:hypothetical protein
MEPSVTASAPNHSPAFFLSLGAAALILFAGLAAYLRSQERAAIASAAINDQLDASGALRPLAEIAQTLEARKLVTVEVRSKVTARTEDSSWRGAAAATVTAPVKLSFGVDLSDMAIDAVTYSPVSRTYLVRVPRPQRIATEVLGGNEESQVQVGWLRFRSTAGEYQLGLARKALYAEALKIALTPKDAAFVRETSRDQLIALVRQIAGSDAQVNVVFADGLSP